MVEKAPQVQLKQVPPAVAVEKAPVVVAPKPPGRPEGVGPVSDNVVSDEDIEPDEQAKPSMSSIINKALPSAPLKTKLA